MFEQFESVSSLCLARFRFLRTLALLSGRIWRTVVVQGVLGVEKWPVHLSWVLAVTQETDWRRRYVQIATTKLAGMWLDNGVNEMENADPPFAGWGWYVYYIFTRVCQRLPMSAMLGSKQMWHMIWYSYLNSICCIHSYLILSIWLTTFRYCILKSPNLAS